MGTSGLHSDNATVDIMLLTNEDDIVTTINPLKCIFIIDRGFMRYYMFIFFLYII